MSISFPFKTMKNYIFTVKTSYKHVVRAKNSTDAINQIAERMKKDPLSFISGAEYGLPDAEKKEYLGLSNVLTGIVTGKI